MITTDSPLYGLVLGGGRSKRMGQDKGAICYHRMPQREFVYHLLSDLLEKAYLSCRPDQNVGDLPTIRDHYPGKGPMGGILSAFRRHPQAAWLVVACDMPFVDHPTLRELIRGRNREKMATCFHNPIRNWPEPLLAIYEPQAAETLGSFMAAGKNCPRKVLMNSPVEELNTAIPHVLNNINTPEEKKLYESQN